MRMTLLVLQKSDFSAVASHVLDWTCTWEITRSRKTECMFCFANFFRTWTAACDAKNSAEFIRGLGSLLSPGIHEGVSRRVDRASFHVMGLRRISATRRRSGFQQCYIMNRAASVPRHNRGKMSGLFLHTTWHILRPI
jgi:hypothetical protein